jgi:hypothetical protein
MSQNNNKLKMITWVARIIAVAVIVFGMAFYLGYGNPLPFINPDYDLWDNVWLTIFPVMFIGLAVGLKFEKIGGYLVTVPVGFGLLMGMLMQGELVFYMLVPLIVGITYLIVGYKKVNHDKNKN